MRVIGTAGHVDHGKSSLVEALTGTHPDRLKEEREREMTIDLGFAWMTLPDGQEVGIIDVPGHRDFIENMLAGVGGIDAALLVVACDEGVMPQTREHLAILDILHIHTGVVALTKSDLIEDTEWLDLVEADVRHVLTGTVLEEAPILRVSAKTRQGIPGLIQAIQTCLTENPNRVDLNRARLPIDRIFTIAGFGTVVTGTLIDGCLRLGDEVEILPQKLRTRIRGLQTHKRKAEIAVPGSRTAVNLTGLTTDQLERGNVLAHPGNYQPTQLLDVRFRMLPDITQSLKHRTEVKLYLGAAEVLASIRLLGIEELNPGQEGWLQLELSQPVVAMRGDRYILRRPSPGETLGGGQVVDPFPKGRHKRFAKDMLNRLEAISQGTPADILFQTLLVVGAGLVKEVVTRSNLAPDMAKQALQILWKQNLFISFEPTATNGDLGLTDTFPQSNHLIISQSAWLSVAERSLSEVQRYHQTYPLRPGILKEEFRSRLGRGMTANVSITGRVFTLTIYKLLIENKLEESGGYIKIPGHQIVFTPQQSHLIDQLLDSFKKTPYAPPSAKDCQTVVGEDVFNALTDLGELILVAPDVVFRKQDFDKMVDDLRLLISKQGSITAAQVRDYFNTSRRYALAFLEYLDTIGITIREGDTRHLKVSSAAE